jgi:hypothetical protein
MLDRLAEKMRRERVPSSAAAPMFLHDNVVGLVSLGRRDLGRGGDVEQLQLTRIQPFAAGTIPAAEQLLDVVLQLLHALLQAGDRGLLLFHDLMAEPDIVGMRGVRAHDATLTPLPRERFVTDWQKSAAWWEWRGDTACGA